MMAVDAATGDLRWLTELDPNPNTIVTTSPVVLGNRLYIATSSAGGGAARQIFRGSLIALDVRHRQVIWQSFVLPDNGGVPGGFAGGAFVNPPAIDLENGLVYRRRRSALLAARQRHGVSRGGIRMAGTRRASPTTRTSTR